MTQDVGTRLAKAISGKDQARIYPTNPGGVMGAVVREGVATANPTGSVIAIRVGGAAATVPIRFIGNPPAINAKVLIVSLGQMVYCVGATSDMSARSGTIVQEQMVTWTPVPLNGTNTAFANAYTSLSFTKMFAATKLRVDIRASAFLTVLGGPFTIGVNIASTDFQVATYYYNALSDHRHFTGVADISSIAAGAQTIQMRNKVVTGATWNDDTNDTIQMVVKEVW